MNCTEQPNYFSEYADPIGVFLLVNNDRLYPSFLTLREYCV